MISERQSEPQPVIRPWFQRHIRLTLAFSVVVVLLLLLVIPSFISISRYKRHITELVAASLGRPVRLSSVELRLLPRPGFVLTDLTVEEDPAYGVEPVLHANTVVAYLRLFPLWRGQLALDRISVDEASLNLVRTSAGRWNVDSLFRTAAPNPAAVAGAREVRTLPYMEATNSRINIKSDAEKLPFSLAGTDASLWQEGGGGGWHIRLRGQPVRTDVSLDQADTGVVRLEATLHPAAELSQMPLHVDLDWREAQLGQLSRLILGSDEDWRGDLTGELHLDGTAEAAHVTSRLRATGVHRAEFAPATELDFDATCAFLYHATARSFENLACNSPIGSGHLRLTGSLPSAPQQPNLTLELDHVPAQAPLDLLRTLRGNLDQSMTAEGAFSGKMTYAPTAGQAPVPVSHHAGRQAKAVKAPNALDGAFTADTVKITGEGISAPVEISKIALQPAPQEPGQLSALMASAEIAAGAPAPLAVAAHLSQSGFGVEVRGPASLGRLRELAHVAGIIRPDALAQMAGDPAALDLRVEGPWLAPVDSLENRPVTDSRASSNRVSSKKISGTIAFHNLTWKPDFLTNPVAVTAATLRLDEGVLHWDPVIFAYGPEASAVKGTATLDLPSVCASDESCTPHFSVHFASLNAAEVQSALLGAHEPGTLLSTLLSRFRTAPAPVWPQMEGTVQADTLVAGAFSLTGASANLHIVPTGAKITEFAARAFGGQVWGNAALVTPTTPAGKPAYALYAAFTGLNPKEVSQRIGQKWSGGVLDGSGELMLAGFSADEITASTKGTLNFDWRNGKVVSASPAPELASFSRWTGAAKIEKSVLTLGENQVQSGRRSTKAEGTLSFGAAPSSSTLPGSTLTIPRR